MSFAELILLAVGLSMDAFAAAVSDGLMIKRRRTAVLAAALFGAFQAAMPIIGYFIGAGFAGLISRWDHFFAMAVLGFIGGKMVIESVVELKSRQAGQSGQSALHSLTFPTMLAQAAATSIDALIVGVTFAAMKAEIVPVSMFIGVVTFVISLVGALGGKRFGTLLGAKASLIGGLVLIGIGIKTLVEHLFF